MEKKGFSLIKVYLLLFSIVGIVGSIVCIGNFSYNILNHVIISDNEYLFQNDQMYLIEDCEYKQNNMMDDMDNTDSNQNFIEKCEKEKKEQLIKGRNVEYKNNLLSFGIRGILFIIITIIHLPIFLKNSKR